MEKHRTTSNILLVVHVILLICVDFGQLLRFESINCPGLPDRTSDNMVVKCSSMAALKTNCSSSMPQGSVGQYYCPKYFKPSQNELSNGTILCSKGEWHNQTNFWKFSCTPVCGSYQEYYPASSPPWHVILMKYHEYHQLADSCSGVLVPSFIGNASIVITNRKCVVGVNETVLETDDLNIAKVGSHFSSAKYKVNKIFLPEDPTANIAILNLTRPVKLSGTVLPVCLVGSGQSSHVHIRANVSRRRTSDYSEDGFVFERNTRSRISMTLVSPESCRTVFGYRPKDDEFCAIKTDDDTTCSDILEPFLVQHPFTSIYEVYGIPTGTLRVNSCPHHVGVYTKVSSNQKWIDQIRRTISGIPEPPQISDLNCLRNCGPSSSCKRNGTRLECQS